MSFEPGRFPVKRISIWERVKELDLRLRFCQAVDKVIHSLLAIFMKKG
jgi:hypothetical protein